MITTLLTPTFFLTTFLFQVPFADSFAPLVLSSIMASSRLISKVVPATNTGKNIRLIGTLDMDGNGTNHPLLPDIDPFILLDSGTLTKNHMPPFGSHPHRGHSVITILRQGKMQTWDSYKPKGEFQLHTGPSSYWVDAGTGVFHDEMAVIQDESDPSQHVELFQLWVGVKEEDRSKPPRVQSQGNLPKTELKDHDSGKVIGTIIHYTGPQTTIETPHPVFIAYIHQLKHTTYRHAVDPTHTGFVAHVRGTPSVAGTKPTDMYDIMVLDNSSSKENNILEITTGDEDAEYLVCSGMPIGEPWVKKLVANGAVIAANREQATGFVENIEAMSKAGKAEGGSFAPFGI